MGDKADAEEHGRLRECTAFEAYLLAGDHEPIFGMIDKSINHKQG